MDRLVGLKVRGRHFASGLVMVLLAGAAFGQTFAGPKPLDTTRSLTGPAKLESLRHKPLLEQYIWAAKAGDASVPVDFRKTFVVAQAPAAATLYIAAGQRVEAWLNGRPVEGVRRRSSGRGGPQVSTADVRLLLRPGKNVLAIEVLRKLSDPDARAAEPMLLAKIVPAEPYVDAKALVMSGAGWKTASRGADEWQRADFSASDWQEAKLLGPAESVDFLQWNRDANLNQWPGYEGISPYLAHMAIYPVKPAMDAGIAPLGAHGMVASAESGAGSPKSVVLDLGREVDGRLQVTSASLQTERITYQYGESMGELENRPYLGVERLTLPPRATTYGSKSAFRYVKLTFFAPEHDRAKTHNDDAAEGVHPGARAEAQAEAAGESEETASASHPVRLADVHVDGIYYPVKYLGSFETSDPELNRIWEVGAYTSHLCMQDGIWDAPKRDRGRWMGDLDVSGAVISHVFADRYLMQDTMDRLNPPGLDGHVNNIPGYSAFWVMGEADYYRAFGSGKYLAAIQPQLLRLLAYMEGDLDEHRMFANKYVKWPFVDWSDDLDKDTPEARKATDFEYYRAFRDGAFLLRAAKDETDAQHYEDLAAQMKASAEQSLKAADGTFGPRVQTNAMAIYSGMADDAETAKIEEVVLHPLAEGKLPPQDLSPYYSNYVIYAMAMAGDREGALKFIRLYWGGMLAEGATSFWEGYDPRWDKQDPHAHLRADDETGYNASLAHGWSSGPTTWLMDEVLGITPVDAGYARVRIRPMLGELSFARGTLPTSHGLLKVDFKSGNGAAANSLSSAAGVPDRLVAKLSVPPGITANVSLPWANGEHVYVDGKQTASKPDDDSSRASVDVPAGHHTLTVH